MKFAEYKSLSILSPEALQAIVVVLVDAYKDYHKCVINKDEWDAIKYAYQSLCTRNEYKAISREFNKVVTNK